MLTIVVVPASPYLCDLTQYLYFCSSASASACTFMIQRFQDGTLGAGAEAENGYAQATVPTTAGNSTYLAAPPIERSSILCNGTEATGVAIGFDTGSTKQGGAMSGAGVDCEDIDAWILQNLDDVNARTLRVELLVQAAKPQQYTHVDVLMAIGDIYDKSVD